jgi:hypothetical protein
MSQVLLFASTVSRFNLGKIKLLPLSFLEKFSLKKIRLTIAKDMGLS